MFERRKSREAHRVMRERVDYHLANLCDLDEIPAPYHSFTVKAWRIRCPGPGRGDRRLRRLSQGHGVRSRWKTELPGRIVRGTVDRFGHVGLRCHRRHLRK